MEQRRRKTALIVGILLPAGCAALLLCLAYLRPEDATGRFAVGMEAYLACCLAGALLLRGEKPERRYGSLALLLGMAYLFLVTPLAVPDEGHHYRMALTLSNYLLGKGADAQTVPAALLRTAGFVRHKCVSSGYLRVMGELFAPLPEGKTASTELAAGGYILFYLPQTLGVTLGRLLGAGMVGTFLLGRLGNLLFYSACVFLAVRRAPCHKTVLGVTALLPMALQQAASFSYDAFTNGAALLFLAELFYAMYGRGRLTRRDLARLILAGMLLAPAKAAYVTMLPLPILAPAERFGAAKEKRRSVAALLLTSAALLACVYLPGLLTRTPADPDALNWESGHNYTMAFVLAHPGETAKIFALSFLNRLPSWACTCVGEILGGTSLFLPLWIPAALLGIAWLSARDPEVSLDGRTRAAFLLTAIGTALLYLITMFFTWTSDDRTIIQGVQGRYFLPVFPLAMIALRFPLGRKKIDLRRFFPPVMAGANALCLWMLLQYTLQH